MHCGSFLLCIMNEDIKQALLNYDFKDLALGENGLNVTFVSLKGA